MSLWDMLRFYADKFVSALNVLGNLEVLLDQPDKFFKDEDVVKFIGTQVDVLEEQLNDLGLIYIFGD